MSNGREQSLRLSIVISSGTGTGTVAKSWDKINWLRIIPVAETDTYRITFKDGDGHIMAKRNNQQGTFAENLELSLGILSTILIENATQDGTYTVKFDLH